MINLLCVLIVFYLLFKLLYKTAQFIIGFGVGLVAYKSKQPNPHYRWNSTKQQWDITYPKNSA